GGLVVADLRNEAGVRAKTAADVGVLRVPVEMPRIVIPVRLERAAGQRLTVPLVSEIGTVRRLRIAVQPLAGHDVARRRTPLKVWPVHAVAGVAVARFAIGAHRADKRQANIAL